MADTVRMSTTQKRVEFLLRASAKLSTAGQDVLSAILNCPDKVHADKLQSVLDELMGWSETLHQLADDINAPI